MATTVRRRTVIKKCRRMDVVMATIRVCIISYGSKHGVSDSSEVNARKSNELNRRSSQ